MNGEKKNEIKEETIEKKGYLNLIKNKKTKIEFKTTKEKSIKVVERGFWDWCLNSEKVK